MVNHYYFYGVDEDFGPFFLKFCSYFPYNAKLCINGHEYPKRQLAKRGVAAEKIDRLLRKWLRRLPHPSSHHAIAPLAIATSFRSCRPSSR